jgi:hypothetical protein
LGGWGLGGRFWHAPSLSRSIDCISRLGLEDTLIIRTPSSFDMPCGGAPGG